MTYLNGISMSFCSHKDPWVFQDQVDFGSILLLLAIRLQKFIIFSDGSFDNQIGTASCMLWDESIHGHITFVVPGMPEDQCTYRSELASLYCQLWFLVLFCHS